MNSLDKLTNLARGAGRVIALPEANDARVIHAARLATDSELAQIVLVGETQEIKQAASRLDVSLDGISVIDPASCKHTPRYAELLHQTRRHKGMSAEEAAELSREPLIFATLMVMAGDAHGCVAGATTPTADVVRNGLQLIGMAPQYSMVSSFFIMEHNLPHQALSGTALFADCALVVDPSPSQLAEIEIMTTDSARNLLNMDPVVAMLSFSTAGSASHPLVDKVVEASRLVAKSRGDIQLMAEVQFDAAIMPEILRAKAPQIKAPAPANVFIFPDLQSANIGYKIAQRIGGAQAIGPILQGLNRPLNDLSRGCSTDDIVELVAVTAAQSLKNT